jgi:hypothetical protein
VPWACLVVIQAEQLLLPAACCCCLLLLLSTGGANCVLGTFLMRDLLGMNWLTWLLPTVCSLGALMLGGMMLEVPRMRRVREVSSSEWNRGVQLGLCVLGGGQWECVCHAVASVG